ncbi:MAG: HAMP domain-containing sensor histidine kinase [Planctomycetaceae bacterium]
MKLRPLILIILIVLLPLAALTWAVFRIAENEQLAVRQGYTDLMQDRLQDLQGNVNQVFDGLQRTLETVADRAQYDVSSMREIHRREPLVMQSFVLNPSGELVYPDARGDMTPGEQMFLLQASEMFLGRDLTDAVREMGDEGTGTRLDSRLNGPVANSKQRVSESPGLSSLRQQSADVSQSPRPFEQSRVNEVFAVNQAGDAHGWFVWYWDRGLNLIYWQRRPTGHIVGLALERARWISDLIAELPETVSRDTDQVRLLQSRVRLMDSSAVPMYQWGTYEPPSEARPLCELALAAPLSSWRLQCFVPDDQLQGGGSGGFRLSLLLGVVALASTLILAAIVVVREYQRDVSEAARQVSFVNHVSHELKTPLTNIRMYAELLERDLDDLEADDARKPKARLDVILAEGQRLSRLIGNVLTFARQRRKSLHLNPQSLVPGRRIREIVDRFRPGLQNLSIDVEFTGDEQTTMQLDADALEQILGNLISNVEKYAADGGRLKVVCGISGDLLTIDVIDSGPGIPPTYRERVFEPFARVSNDLSYAAGTGIGLPIARELARLHGGDVVLQDSSRGCWFQATLRDAAVGGREPNE